MLDITVISVSTICQIFQTVTNYDGSLIKKSALSEPLFNTDAADAIA